MKVKTSFGEVYIEAEYMYEERILMDGYQYVEDIKEGKLYVIKTTSQKSSYALLLS